MATTAPPPLHQPPVPPALDEVGIAAADEGLVRPYVPDSTELKEMTPGVIILGVVLGLIFAASSVYLALKIGLTVSASIPIAVLSITIFRYFAKAFGAPPATILQNNMVQTTGSAGEVLKPYAATVPGHQGHAFERLESPQQHAGAGPGTARGDVEGEPAAVDEVDVGMPALEEQRRIAGGLALVGMAAGIAHDVGLGFDDASAHQPAPVLAHERLADKPASQ